MRDKQTSLAEKKFLLQALAKRIRLDERKLGQQRKINIQCSENIPGTCLVSLGQSKVLIQTNFKVEEPREIRPIEGRHRIKIEESTAPVYEDTKNNKNETNRSNPYSDIQELLEQAFITSKALDLESLCIRAGNSSFTIESRLSILSDDGSLPDVCSIAVAVGLKHFRLPTTIVEGESVTINNNSKKSLAIFHLPYLVTFATFPNAILDQLNNNSGIRKTKAKITSLDEDLGEMILDPTRLESKLSNGNITLAINKHKELCGMKTQGGICLSMKDIEAAYNLALNVVRNEITPAVENSLLIANQVEKFNLDDDIVSQDPKNEAEAMADDSMDDAIDSIVKAGKMKAENGEENGDVDGGLVSMNTGPMFNESDWGIDELIGEIRKQTD